MLKHIKTIVALLKTIVDQLTLLTDIVREVIQSASAPEGCPDTDDELLDTQQVVDFLGIDRATFYRRVYKVLLLPSAYRGCIPVYSKKKVQALKFSLPPHEKGAHTFSRAAAKKQKRNGVK